MLRFRDYVKGTTKPILIPVAPIHGSHAKKPGNDNSVLIPTDPVHGSHSKPPVSEEHDDTGHTDFSKFINHNPNSHLGNEIGDVHNSLDKDRDDFIHSHNNLSAVHEYTSGSYAMNRHLLAKAKGHKGLLDSTDSEWDHEKNKEKLGHIKSLDQSLAHPNARLKHDVTVFHGASFNPDELASQHPQRHIHSSAFLSTSINPSTAQSFGGRHILRIHLRKNKDHALYLGSNSVLPHEQEMIIPRDTTLHIHHTPEHISSGDKVWDAHVVHQDHEHKGYNP